ncbi:MAG: hypothetical protein Q8Q14_09335 [Gemmatimonadales bacterium]|nr:hypothetical protein [Gemmatimonadales bacterium]
MTLSVLLLVEAGAWVAQAIETDVAGRGVTQAAAVQDLARNAILRRELGGDETEPVAEGYRPAYAEGERAPFMPFTILAWRGDRAVVYGVTDGEHEGSGCDAYIRLDVRVGSAGPGLVIAAADRALDAVRRARAFLDGRDP